MTGSDKKYTIYLLCSLSLAVVVMLWVSYSSQHQLEVDSYWFLLAMMFILSAFCEYVDNSIGMGYGTILLPLLLILGLQRQETVPAILSAQLLAGVCGCIAHHREGNVNIRKNSNIHRALLILGIPSFAGAVIASSLGITLSAQGQHWLNLYIGMMIAAIGLFLVIRKIKKRRQESKGGTLRLIILGLIASFNKGVSGGGYGPLMTGGQLFSGIGGKEAIVITNLCESFTCLVALVAWFAMGGKTDLLYTIALCAGALLTVIPSAKTVKILQGESLKQIIGWATLFLGLITLFKWITT